MGNALQGSVLVPLVFKMSVSDWFTMVDKTTLPVMRLVTHHMYRDSRPQIRSYVSGQSPADSISSVEII